MKKLLFVLLLVGCSYPICDAGKKVGDTFAGTIAVSCGCHNLPAIQASMYKVLSNAQICPPPENKQGVVGDILCPAAGTLLTQFLASSFPTEWQCENAVACVSGVVALGVSACQAVFPVRSH